MQAKTLESFASAELFVTDLTHIHRTTIYASIYVINDDGSDRQTITELDGKPPF